MGPRAGQERFFKYCVVDNLAVLISVNGRNSARLLNIQQHFLHPPFTFAPDGHSAVDTARSLDILSKRLEYRDQMLPARRRAP